MSVGFTVLVAFLILKKQSSVLGHILLNFSTQRFSLTSNLNKFLEKVRLLIKYKIPAKYIKQTMTIFWYKYIQNIVLHTYTKIICFYLKFKAPVIYLPNLAILVKREYRKDKDYFYLAEKRLFIPFFKISCATR